MITFIQGKLVSKTPTEVIVESHGLGYVVHISLHTFSQIPDSETIKLHTYFLVREDAHTLYGFWEPAERELFKLLISVSGVGASTARTLLSASTPKQIAEAILHEDVPFLQAAKGIGAKTAQRLVLELRDKVVTLFGEGILEETVSNTTKLEALSALETLGFAKKQAEKVCDAILSENSSATVETIIKLALKKL